MIRRAIGKSEPGRETGSVVILSYQEGNNRKGVREWDRQSCRGVGAGGQFMAPTFCSTTSIYFN